MSLFQRPDVSVRYLRNASSAPCLMMHVLHWRCHKFIFLPHHSDDEHQHHSSAVQEISRLTRQNNIVSMITLYLNAALEGLPFISKFAVKSRVSSEIFLQVSIGVMRYGVKSCNSIMQQIPQEVTEQWDI